MKYFLTLFTLLICVFLISGCVIVGGSDDGGGSASSSSSSQFEEDILEEEEQQQESLEEESTEETSVEITESSEETTSTTTTTTVEDPGNLPSQDVTCSAADQGFGEAEAVTAYMIDPPEGCTWSEKSSDVMMEQGLGFLTVQSDENYLALFECADRMLSSDVNWSSEHAVYVSGWVPAGSAPAFEWAVIGPDMEVVLGLISDQVCTEETEFFQSVFITPALERAPRVISCANPTDCQ